MVERTVSNGEAVGSIPSFSNLLHHVKSAAAILFLVLTAETVQTSDFFCACSALTPLLYLTYWTKMR